MGHLRLWDTDAIGIGDVPTVQDVLLACDLGTLARVYAEEYGRSGYAEGGGYPDRLRKTVAGALDEMCQLDVKRDEGSVVLPLTRFDLDRNARGGSVLVSTCAELLKVDDLRLAGREAEAIEGALRTDVVGADDGFEHIPGYAIGFLPWEEALGALVWLGPGLTRRERFMVLADFVHELTFSGYEHGRASERLSSLLDDLGGRAVRSEEGNRESIPLEVLEARFGLLGPECLGLQGTTDDLEGEFLEAHEELVCELNEQARLRMLGLADRLWQMLRRGYSRQG